MSLFGWITGSSKSAEKAVDGVVNGLDAMFFTDEEKSQANMKALELKIEFARATAGMSISRRIIVVMVSTAWLLLVMLAAGLGLWLGKDAAQVTWLIELLTDVVMQPFSIIVGFYFLAQVAGAARGK
jgi:hypothetical protein